MPKDLPPKRPLRSAHPNADASDVCGAVATATMKRGAQGGGGAKKRRSGHGTELTAGMRGVIITCDSHLEHKAIRECFERFGMVTETGPRASGPKDDAAGAAFDASCGEAVRRRRGMYNV